MLAVALSTPDNFMTYAFVMTNRRLGVVIRGARPAACLVHDTASEANESCVEAWQ